MADPIPACIHCQTNKYVQRDHTAERAGTVIGGTVGAGAAYFGAKSGAVAGAAACSFLPGLGTIFGAIAGSATGVLLGFISGSATGNLVGERIDAKIRMVYRCNQCGRTFNE